MSSHPYKEPDQCGIYSEGAEERQQIRNTSTNEDDDGHPFISIREALVFLFAYQAQVLTALNELNGISSKMEEDNSTKKQYSDEDLDDLWKEESYANTVFMRLRSRLCKFMSQSKGIKLV